MKKCLFVIVVLAAIFFNIHNVSAYYFANSLSVGMRGQEVIELQTLLKAKGYYNYPEITGYYGQVTVSAVQSFQTANGLSPVGNVGPQTKALLNSGQNVNPNPTPTEKITAPLGIGARGQGVVVLQTILKAQGFYTYPQITGYYGPSTAQAVKLFQEKYATEILYPANLTQGTGYAGLATVAKLNQLAGSSACTSPTLANPGSLQGTVDSNFSYTMLTNGTVTTFTINGLPPGLSYYQQTISGTPTVAGQYTITVVVGNSCGNNTETIRFVINPSTAKVPSVTLSASPTTVTAGGTSVLSWSTQNVTTCTASNDWSGSKSLSGSETTSAITSLQTFTLSCTGAYGSVGQSVSVGVTQGSSGGVTQPPVVSLSASPSSVVQGNSTTLSWSATGALYCIAGGGWSGTKNTSGNFVTSALSTATVFSIACGNTGGTTTQSTTVSVTAPIVTEDQKVLVVYNSNNSDSVAIKDYYLSHRPTFSQVSSLDVSISSAEIIDLQTFTDSMLTPISTWINQHPTKSIKYIVLMPGLPTRISGTARTTETTSVQVRINNATNAYVTTLEMGNANASRAYIDKLSSGNSAVLSGSVLGKAGTTYYFDDAHGFTGLYPNKAVRDAVLAANSTATVFYTDTDHVTTANDVAGYMTWGGNGGQGADYPIDGSVAFTGKSSWYPIETVESYNGMFYSFHLSNFIKWFSAGAFGGTNYSNTPIGGVTHTEEPGYGGINTPNYFVLWDQGKTFAEAAWGSRITPFFMAVGDPLVTK